MGILKGTSCTVKDDRGNVMIVATPFKGYVTFYPHHNPVSITYEEAKEMLLTIISETESANDAQITIDIPEVKIND